MARTDITVSTPTYGLALMTETAADASNEMSFSNDGKTILVVSNEHASTACNVTIAVNADEYGRDVTETLSIAAGRVGYSTFLPPQVYNQANNKVHVDFDVDTDVKVAAIRMPRG